MCRLTCFCLFALIAALPPMQAAPAPKRTNARAAVINAGTEKNIEAVSWYLVNFARIAVRENENVAKMDIIRRQKDWESWLKKNLRFERVKDTNLVRVSFQDGNAKEQTAIINVVVDYYIKNDVVPRRDLLKKTVEDYRRRLVDPKIRRRYTAQRLAKAEEDLKEREENIQKLPALVEHAEVP